MEWFTLAAVYLGMTVWCVREGVRAIRFNRAEIRSFRTMRLPSGWFLSASVLGAAGLGLLLIGLQERT